MLIPDDIVFEVLWFFYVSSKLTIKISIMNIAENETETISTHK